MQCAKILAKIKVKVKKAILNINHRFQKIATDCEANNKMKFKPKTLIAKTISISSWKCLMIGTSGLVGSAPAWDGTGCEFDSWHCRIYIPCSLSLRLLGSLWSLWVHMAWHKNCVKKKKDLILSGKAFQSMGPWNDIVFRLSEVLHCGRWRFEFWRV